MSKCPKCNASLPDAAYSCQFCGSSWGAPPPVRRAGGRGGATTSGGWERKAYYAISAWWMISGILSILSETVLADADSGGNILGIASGAFMALVGLGLILNVEFIRSFVNIVCFVNIAFGCLGVLGFFLFAAAPGIWGPILLLAHVLDMALSVLMIYVIGETDRAPDF